MTTTGTPAATSGNDEDEPSAAEQVRAAETARWDRKVAKAQARGSGTAALAEAEATEQAANDLRDQRKAESYRARLIDPGRALARSWRTYRLILGLLVGCLLLVIAWNARTVAVGLGGPDPAWLDYAAEAPLSVPLLVVLLLQVSAAMNGRLEQVRPVRRRPSGWVLPTPTGLLELVLLSLSVAVCTVPALTVPHPRFEHVATSALPPFSLVAAALLIYTTVDLFSGIFRDHRASEGEGDSMRRRLELAMDLALDVERAQAGDNPLPTGDDGLPSISAIGKRFKGEKAVHQTAHDLLVRFSSRREVPVQHAQR